MPQVEIGNVARDEIGIGKPRSRIGCGEARDRKRGIDGVAQGLQRKIRAARVPALLTDIDRHAETFVAVVLDGLDFAAAHGDRLPETFAHFGFRRSRATRLRVVERRARDFAQLLGGVGEAGGWHKRP